MANHGVVAVGRHLDEALEIIGLVERLAQIYVLAKCLNKVNLIPPDVVESLRKFFKE